MAPPLIAATRLPMGISIDVSTSDVCGAGALASGLAAGLQTFVPWLPQTTSESMAAAAACLRRSSLIPVPHIAARRLGSADLARRLLDTLCGRSGVESALLIGGDIAQPAGPYESSLELLHSGALTAAGIRSVGFAGYPEGRPGMAPEVLWQSLHDKLECARAHGLDTFIVSQFCFDGVAIAGWLRQLRARGIAAPVRIGVAGPATLRKLLQVGLQCGVGHSLRTLRGRIRSIASLAATHGPDDVVRGLAKAVGGTALLEHVTLHVFAFGGIEPTARWIAKFRNQYLHSQEA